MAPADYQLRNQLFENSSAISHQDGYHSTAGGSSVQGVSLNFSNSVAQMPYQNAQYVPGGINISIHSNPTNSGTSFDESSLITGVNSSLYGGSNSQGPGINSMESIASISGSSPLDQFSAQGQGGRFQNLTSMPQFSVPSHNASVSSMMMFNRPSLEMMTEETLLPNCPQQISLRQAMQMKCLNDRALAYGMIQQQQSPHQLQNAANSNNINIQALMRAATQPQQAANNAMNAGLAVRRLTSYVYHRRQRPPDNNIEYWRSFVMYFYSPHVQRRTCFSTHPQAHAGRQAQAQAWRCVLCGSTPSKGFVETFDVLPRMNQLYFRTDVVDELLFLDFSSEKRLPDGSLMVQFEKAVQETIYNHCRVIHEGKLRVVFTSQLKIISWVFCVQHHEVLLPRKLIAAKVNDYVKSTTRCKSNADAKDHDGAKEHGLLSNSNRAAAVAKRTLSATLEQPHISVLGLSKHFARSLQVSEVLNTMKDLMTYSLNNNTSPIETLKLYGRQAAVAKFEARDMEPRSRMQKTPGPPDHRNFPVQYAHPTGNSDHTSPAANYMAATPISNGNAMYNSPSPYQILPGTPQMMNKVSAFPSSCQSPISPAQSSPSPSTVRRNSIVEQFMLNDLLGQLQSEAAKQPQSNTTRGNCNITYDPNGEDAHIVPGRTRKRSRLHNNQSNSELATGQFLGCKAENGKIFNSSSSSNSSRVFPDCNYLRSDTDLDEDFTSPAQAQGPSINYDRPQ